MLRRHCDVFRGVVFRNGYFAVRPVENVESDIGGGSGLLKQGVFPDLWKYACGDKMLVTGLNFGGQPFGGMARADMAPVLEEINRDLEERLKEK